MLMLAIVSPRAGVNNRPATPCHEKFDSRGESVMKKSRLWILVAIAIAAVAAILAAQNKPASPPGDATLKFADGKSVSIQYSRPSMRGRKIFGGLVPYDQVWRTGANAATSLKTNVALTIGGASVPAGSYTLYTLPGANSWKLIINKQTGQWGTDYEQLQDLTRVNMKVSQRSSPLEQFTISFDKTGGDSASLKLEWDTTVAAVEVQEKKVD
jgi:Protein of unknown function (DUF2911)